MDASDPNDPVGSLDVEVSTDGATWNAASWGGADYTYAWDTSVNGDGPATIEARVTDSAATTVYASPVSVTVGSPLGNYRDAVLGDSPVSYWRLGEAAGTTAVDIVGGHDGTYTGAPTLGVNALITDPDTAVRFDGSDDMVPMPNNPDQNTGGPYTAKTIEFWFNADEVTSRQVLWEQGATARGINIYLLNGRLYAGAWNTANDPDPSTPWASSVFVSTPVAALTTTHVAMTFDYPTDTLALYVNGALAASAGGLGLLYAHGGAAAIGAMNGGTLFHDQGDGGGNKHFFDGVIDEVAIYNTALSSAAILSHHALGGPEIDYADTVVADGANVYWRLGEASGTLAADVFGGSNATYSGTPGLGTPGVILDPNTAVAFDGVNDIVEVSNGVNVNTGGPYASKTVELWFNADNVTDRQVLWEQGATARGISIYLLNGRLYAGAWNTVNDPDPSTPWAGPVFVSTPVSVGNVYHVALVFDYPTDTLALYVNGSQAASAGGLGLLFRHGGTVGIGAMRGGTLFHDQGDGGGNKHFFDGVIDEVALYPLALNPAKIANHYTLGLL
jgi:hypothetical protein